MWKVHHRTKIAFGNGMQLLPEHSRLYVVTSGTFQNLRGDCDEISCWLFFFAKNKMFATKEREWNFTLIWGDYLPTDPGKGPKIGICFQSILRQAFLTPKEQK